MTHPSINALQAELELAREAESELRVAFDSSFDGIWVLDGDGKVLRINRAYERISGIAAEEVVGRKVGELVEAGFLSRSVTEQVIEAKQTITILNQVRNGKTMLVTGTPVVDDQGRVNRVVINARDISELMDLKAELERAKALNTGYLQELTNIRLRHHVDLVARSAAMEKVIDLAFRIARVDTTVLITGESGTGKEVVANLIHRESPRQKGPYIRINCGAIPDSLLESELFGYDRGAFTGANRDGKPGLFELANLGTLFLDEVAELPLPVQVKLLRALQTKEITRVGGTRPVRLDIRLVAATNRDLESMVREGKFREDLYYRLNIVPIHVPPLRERPEDISPLVFHFLRVNCSKYGLEKHFSPSAVDSLVSYRWPGNVRELENLVERLVVTTQGEIISIEDLPAQFRPGKSRIPGTSASLRAQVQDLEKNIILEAVSRAGSLRQAALVLGVDASTLTRKARRLGI